MTLIHGWRVDAEYLIGRRFEWTNNAAPDVTFVSWKKDGGIEFIRAHALDGGCHWMPMLDVCAAIEAGIFVESAHGVPFTNDRSMVFDAAPHVPTWNGRR
jgi:hypothetical protein